MFKSRPEVTTDIVDKPISWVRLGARKIDGTKVEADVLVTELATLAQKHGFEVYYLSSHKNAN